jgi:hypothetical protein
MRTTRWALALATGTSMLLSPGLADARTDKETFTATVLRSADMRQDGSRTWTITFNVVSWTSEEDLARLGAILKEGGPEALLREFREGRSPAGYVVGFSREPSWRLAMATAVDTPRGRVVRMITDRPVSLAETWAGAQSRDYEFAVFEFTLDERGQGQGLALPAARLVEGWDRRLEFEPLPYSSGPDRLIGVRTWRSESASD